MKSQTYPYQPIGGINLEDAEDQLEQTQVVTAENFLFERKQFLNRPAAVKTTLAGFTGNVTFAKTFNIGLGPRTLAISSNGKIYRLDSLSAATEITGAGTAFVGVDTQTAIAVNDVVLIGNCTAGSLRWDPAGTVYTTIGSSNYRYLTSHATRAVGVHKLDSAAGDLHRIGWSQSGDETLWTGGDSGTSNLVDSPDATTGVGVLHNVLVIPRRTGFHLGYLTGLNSPTYRFEPWSRDGIGCSIPASFVVYDNQAYFISRHDVNTFDLQKVDSIGKQVRSELLTYIRAGYGYRGFITVTNVVANGRSARPKYHLVPVNASLPHFCYDIEEATWSRHLYSFQPSGGFSYLNANFIDESPCLLQSASASLWTWTVGTACETIARLTSRSLTIGVEEVDQTVRRLLLKYRNNGEYNVVVKVRASINQGVIENDDTQGIGKNPADSQLYRRWFNIGVAGQDFQVTLEVPADHQFAGTYMGLRVAESGEYKGE